MSDFLHLADKFKNKLGISQQPSQQGYPGPPSQYSPGGYSGSPYNYQQPQQFPAQYTQPWEHQQPPGFPSPAQYIPPRPSDGSVPPPIPPRTGPPAIPDRPTANPTREPELAGATALAGAIYAPGTYPTPDLFDFPLGKHT
ncbi:hypothetical protein FS749_002902, partial [Ceratobasidium sp. UAMH 11750]